MATAKFKNPETGEWERVGIPSGSVKTFNGRTGNVEPMAGDYTAEMVNAAPAVEDTDQPGCYYRMVNGVKEWINPPVENDETEYRTTERYEGKPVYVRIISCGSAPASGYKTVWREDIPNLGTMIRYAARSGGGGAWSVTLPGLSGGSTNYGWHSQVGAKIENGELCLIVDHGYSAQYPTNDIYVMVHYNKTTD